MRTGAKSDEEKPKDTLIRYEPPKEEPVLTMGGNFYYRLHLLLMDVDRSALNDSLEDWYKSLFQVYVNIKPMLVQPLVPGEYSQLSRSLQRITKKYEITDKDDKEVLEYVAKFFSLRKRKIDMMFEEVEGVLFDPRIHNAGYTQGAFYKARAGFKARKLLGELNSYVLYKLNQAKMLFPTMKKKDFGYFTRAIVGNKKNYKSQMEPEYDEHQHNV